MRKFPSDISVSKNCIDANLELVERWDTDNYSHFRNGAHGQYPKLPLSVLYWHNLGNCVVSCCDCGISWSYSVTFLMSVKQSCLDKSVTKHYELCHESVIMPCLFLIVLLG